MQDQVILLLIMYVSFCTLYNNRSYVPDSLHYARKLKPQITKMIDKHNILSLCFNTQNALDRCSVDEACLGMSATASTQ